MLDLISKAFLKLIGGTRNERIIRGKMSYVRERINPLEEQMRALSDAHIREKSDELKRRRAAGEARERIKPEAFALVREASWRAQRHRHFDVQLVAGLVLDDGWIAEEATGEGKTIACYPAIYMAALDGMHAHVVTPNDYLVKVGAEFARPV
ncbi:MAG: preprotein translocase subunit SecA, partial [Planctomycetota bacterium]